MSEISLTKLVIASHNKGKVKEIADLLAPLNISIVTAEALGLPEPEENGATFEENSTIKAVEIATSSQLPALADDSGLVIPSLNGDPGIYSARWAEIVPGGPRDFDVAIAKVGSLLDQTQPTPAYMICVLTLAFPQGKSISFEGKIHGHIVFPKRGNHGFGYDPIFKPEGYEQTFGEMDPAYKHAISHRAQAFAKFLDYLKG